MSGSKVFIAHNFYFIFKNELTAAISTLISVKDHEIGVSSENLEFVCVAVSYSVVSTSVQGICRPITMITCHKFLPVFNIEARRVTRSKPTAKVYLYFFGSVSHFLGYHLHQHCVPN